MLPTPQNLTVVDAGGGQLTASWDAVDISNVSPYPGQVSYELIGVNAGNNPVFEDYPSDTTDTFAAPANVVNYYVFAIAGEDMSGYSNAADAPDQSAPVPAAPQNLSATPYADGTGSGIRLLWDNDSDNETGFTIERSTSADFSTDLQTFTVDADVTSYVDTTGTEDTSVQPGTTYYYQVEANGSGSSAFSNTASAAVTLPTVSVTALDPNANFAGPDGNPQDAYLDFHRTGNFTSALTASVSYAGSTAVAGTDYSGTLPTTVTFPAGAQDVIIPVVPANGSPDFATDIQATITDPPLYIAASEMALIDPAAHGLSAVLGDGSNNVIIQNSADGQTNTTPLVLTFPANAESSVLTLHSAQCGILAVYQDGTLLPWTDTDGDTAITVTAIGDRSTITLAVAATAGSTEVNDVRFTMYDNDLAGSAPATAESNPATAVLLVIKNSADTVISGTAQNYEVGQVADLHAFLESPFPASAASGYVWKPQGNVLYDWHEPVTPITTGPMNTSRVPLAANNGTTGTQLPRVRFFWVSAGSGAGSQIVSEQDQVQLTVPIGSHQIQTSATFNVSEPSVQSAIQYGAPGSGWGTVRKSGPYTGMPINNFLPYPFPGLTPPANAVKNGVVWSAVVNAPGGGNWKFVQLIKPSKILKGPTSSYQTLTQGSLGLDTSDPYGTTYPATGSLEGCDGDSPGIYTRSASQLGFTSYSINFEAVDYIMFEPAGVSQWVPLQVAQWGFIVAGRIAGDGLYTPINTVREMLARSQFVATITEPTWNWYWEANSDGTITSF